MGKKAAWLLLALILTTGIYARFKDLAWHFTNVDDRGVAEIIFRNRETGEFGAFPISRFYTYAPLQFFITPLLIDAAQPYRTMLFRGRLPSCVLGIAGILALAFFFRKREGRWAGGALLALALLACSWENIIHAKQMHNYALGVTAAILLTILYDSLSARERLGLRELLPASLALAVLAHAQYQILALVPWFYLALFLPRLQVRPLKDLAVLAGKFILSGLLYGILIFPMVYFLLRRFLEENAGAPGVAQGIHGEFLFRWPQAVPVLEGLRYAATFFLRNFLIVFQANTAFTPENSPAAGPAGIVLLMIFIAGVWGMARSEDRRTRRLGLFFALIAASWTFLIVSGKLTFGPTRHTLILLPFFLVMVREGWRVIWQRLPETFQKREAMVSAAVVLAVLGLFQVHYPQFLRERRDPFVESEILETFHRYKVDTIFTNERSDGIRMMPGIRQYQDEVQATTPEPYQTVAWISKSDLNIPFEQCDPYREQYNMQLLMKAQASGKMEPFAKYACSEYRKVYEKKIDSDLQVDYSRRTRVNIYTNSLFFYIFSRLPAPESPAPQAAP